MKRIAIAAAALMLCGTANAQVGSSTTARASDNESTEVSPDSSIKNGSDTDPNRVICRSQKVVGSRLHSKRICATSAQWAQMRADQRAEVERVQKDMPITGQ